MGAPTIGARLGVAGRLAAAFQAHALTPLLALVALLLGLFAVLVTPREEEPQINVTMANVIVPFPGASSADVQAMVAKPAEQVLGQIAGIEHTYSVSRPGVAVLTVQFKVGVPRTEALVRLYDVLNANQDWLPRDLGTLPPIVKPKGIDDVPVLAATLWSRDDTAAHDLERVARSIEAELKRVPGTREVQTIGGPGRVVQVALDPARLRERGVDVVRLKATLAAANLGMPSGAVLDTAGCGRADAHAWRPASTCAPPTRWATWWWASTPADRCTCARSRASRPVPRSPRPTCGTRPVWRARRRRAAGGVHPALTITVTKKPGQNAVDVARAVRDRLDELRNTVLPPDVQLTISRDYGETAAEKANKLIQKLAFATASVIVLVALALGRREAVIVGAAVILTLTATLFASWAWGFTLNRVSLFALIFSIGILVDDAIVVVENIHRHQQLEPGKALRDIIPAAVDEVGGPTILATLTVIAALLPMAFVSGLMGPYMSPIPINSSLGMALSLAIAFTVTPWLALKLMKGHGSHSSWPRKPGNLGARLQRLFHALLMPFLDSAKKRWLLLAGIVGALLLSVGLAAVQWVVLKMLPFDNKSEFQLVVEMPAGTPLEDTAATLQEMGAFLAKQPEVRDLQGYAGTASPITFNGLVRQYYLRADAEQGDLQVNLVDKHHRSEQSHAIAQRLRPALERIAAAPPRATEGGRSAARPAGDEPAGGRGLRSRRGRPPAARAACGRGLRADARHRGHRHHAEGGRAACLPARAAQQGRVARHPGGHRRADGAGRAVGRRRGLPARRAGQVAGAGAPAIAARIAGGARIAAGAAVARRHRAARAAERAGARRARRHRQAAVHEGPARRELCVRRRRHACRLAADCPTPRCTACSRIRTPLKAAALPGTGELGEYWIKQPSDPYRQYAIKWDGEWQITYETFRDMGAAYAVGLVLIYLLVVAQFKSYSTPLVIMAPIPLTLIGVMPGHALLGAQFTATSMIGMIALAGIIVRNSILLVDFIELQVARGVAFKQAVVESAAVRAQPIALTALAAMIGATFILDDPIFNGLAVSLIFGILVSTLLTLVVIPVLYYAVYRRRFEPRLETTPA